MGSERFERARIYPCRKNGGRRGFQPPRIPTKIKAGFSPGAAPHPTNAVILSGVPPRGTQSKALHFAARFVQLISETPH
jgi:hypothetical protein